MTYLTLIRDLAGTTTVLDLKPANGFRRVTGPRLGVRVREDVHEAPGVDGDFATAETSAAGSLSFVVKITPPPGTPRTQLYLEQRYEELRAAVAAQRLVDVGDDPGLVRTYRVRRANLTPSQDRGDVVACRLFVTIEWPSAQPGYAVTTLP